MRNTDSLWDMTYLCEEDGEPLKQSKLSVAIIFQHMSIPLMVKDWSDATSVQATHSFLTCSRTRPDTQNATRGQ